MRKSRSEYIKKLRLQSIALKDRANDDRISYKEATELRKKQDKVYKKFIFAKQFSLATDKKEREKNE